MTPMSLFLNLAPSRTIGKKGLVGGAAAVHANKIWLVFGATVILNFRKRSIPRMGPATATCKNWK